HALAWDPFGHYIAVAGHTTGVQRFSAEGWHAQPNLERMDTLEPAYSVRWSPDGNLLAASGGRLPPSVNIWNGRSARRERQLLPDTDTILTIAWSHDSALLAAGSAGGRIDVWSTRDWRSVRLLNGQADQITDLDFSYDDQFLSSKSADGTVVLWDTRSWREVVRLPDPGTGHGLFAPLAFHPKQMMLATLGRNGNALRIWEINATSMTPKPRPRAVPQKDEPIPPHLVNAVKEQRVILFAGAGISIEALGVTTLSVRQGLVQDIKKQHSSYNDSQRSFEEVADEWACLHDLLTLQNKLAALIPQDRPPSLSHVAAVKLFPKIVTTNWDLLFEEAYRGTEPPWQKLVADTDADNLNAGSRALLKIHGCASQPASLIATSKQFETYHLTHPRLLKCVGQLLEGYPTLFVGYGLGDEHIRRVVSTAAHLRGDRAYRLYVVGFFDDVRANLLRKRQFEVIQADASSFLPRLAARVR
ncbi:MAG: SIR2 family protein, partial [Planctomycetota bacterium]|nr:SIR2 family protein [Planctomycetota bacterium]